MQIVVTSFLTICLLFLSDSDQRRLEYGCSYHTGIPWLVTSVCLYIYMSLVYERVLENVLGVLENPGKVLEIFLNKSAGTLQTNRTRPEFDSIRLPSRFEAFIPSPRAESLTLRCRSIRNSWSSRSK